VGDAEAMAEMFAAVAEERDGIATEPPVDIGERAAQFARTIASSVVAVAGSQVIGMLHVEVTRHGFGEMGMLVGRGWRGRGVGSALVQAAIGLARDLSLHKLSLEVFAHNTAAIALYRKCGFVEEGRRTRQYRRASGELWDSIVMGLVLLGCATRAVASGGPPDSPCGRAREDGGRRQWRSFSSDPRRRGRQFCRIGAAQST
jgi:RimJ/RimL family protein N-acetyltransferase